MDKKGCLIRSEEAGHSSSSSGADTTRVRYKPLAPKKPSAPGTSASPPDFEDEPSPAADLTFVNFTDPLQSKSQESRKLVRTQVMRNFTREQKKQKARGDAGSGSGEGSASVGLPSNASWISQRGRVLKFTGSGTKAKALQASTASSAESNAATTRPSASIMGEALRPKTARARSLPSAPDRAPTIIVSPTAAGRAQLVWPVVMESHDELLKNHCLSSNFRASNPLYMISLLAKRPGADRYPLMVDIDSSTDISGPGNVEQNLLFRLAEGSASLAHAIMMVSASDLALRQVNKAMSDRLVIYHKSKALTLLNEAIQDVQSSDSLETLATAAVLSCHELVVGDYKAWAVHILGFSRIIAMNGGIKFLDRENPVRQLILWSDQVGALFMNMRPLFPASAVFASSSALSQNISQHVTEQYREGGFQDLLSWQYMQAEGKLSQDLVSVMEDINLVAFIGAQAILDETSFNVAGLIDVRDQIIHRLLYLSPPSREGDGEYSYEECVRLAMLLITLDRLFSPVLPGAYFQLTHMVADRLAALISGHALANDWLGHEWAALWICFVGTSVSTNNPSTRSGFVTAGAPLCRSLFSGPQQMDEELEDGLRAYARPPLLYGSELMEAFVSDLKDEVSRLK